MGLVKLRDSFVSSQLIYERVEVSGENRVDVYLCQLTDYLPIRLQLPSFAIDDPTERSLSLSPLLLGILHLHLLCSHLVGHAVGRGLGNSLLLR